MRVPFNNNGKRAGLKNDIHKKIKKISSSDRSFPVFQSPCDDVSDREKYIHVPTKGLYSYGSGVKWVW